MCNERLVSVKRFFFLLEHCPFRSTLYERKEIPPDTNRLPKIVFLLK